jgi:hypothetical protein
MSEDFSKVVVSGLETMNPKRKDNQGLDFWAEEMRKIGAISQKEFDDFVEQNNSKEEVMERRGVPQLGHYGFFSSVKEIKDKLESRENQRFIIRCKSKSDLSIKRLLDASLDDICKFAEDLPGGFESWDVEVKEFAPTIVSGTIIISPSGKTLIESWLGAHYLNVTNSPKCYANYDPTVPNARGFTWGSTPDAKDVPVMQQYAMKALRYLLPNLKPHENDQVYAEYAVKENGEVYFIEVNDSVLLTGRD